MALRTAPRGFPATRISVIQALGSKDAEQRRAAGDLLARAYWGPVVWVLRTRWRLADDDAEDLAQDFFADALTKDWFVRYDPAIARFRTFLRLCVDRFAANAVQSSHRLKRGGGAVLMPLLDAAVEVANDDTDIDARFREEWVRSVFTMALEALRIEGREAGKETHVAIFEAYDVDDPPDDQRASYRELGLKYGLPETTITNHLAWARRTFRRHVLEVLQSLSGSEDEYRADAQELLGIRLP